MRFILSTITIFFVVLLTGCQSDGPFTAAQKQALQQQGFHYLGERWELGLNDKILFGIDQSSLTTASKNKIIDIATNLKSVGINHVSINGHTDNYGEASYNQQLSLKRAQSVARVWMESTGEMAEQVVVHGYGMEKPIASNKTSQGRAMNRRVAIVVEAP